MRWRCCWTAGATRARAKARSCCSRARLASASRAFWRRLRERIGDEPHVTVRYQCSPHHVNDAFYPITSHIWHAAGFVSGEPAAARLDKLEAMIARSGVESKEVAPLLASLLSIPVRGTVRPARNGAGEAEGADDRGVDRAVRGLDEGRPRPRAVGGRTLDRSRLRWTCSVGSLIGCRACAHCS